MSEDIVYFVHISDTHFGPSADYTRRGVSPRQRAGRVVEIINNLPVRPDFVIHTGDVAWEPEPEPYVVAAETFAALRAPIYFVNGNHDTAANIRRSLAIGPRQDLAPEKDVLSYAFEVKGFRFLVLDARGPDDIDPHGWLSETQLALARRECEPVGPPLVVFLHFPCLPLNSPWMDENMLITNGLELHEILRRAGERLRGVFYGHVHKQMQTLRDGVLYVATASTHVQFSAWPGETMVTIEDETPPGFNFVQLLPEQTIVQQMAFGP